MKTNHLIWLVTVNQRNEPKPTLAWYWWDGSTVLIYSQPEKPKLRNIAANPNVALHLDAERDGSEEVTIVSATAVVDRSVRSVSRHPEYRDKYSHRITDGLNMTVDEFSSLYSVPILVTPKSTRLW